MHSNLKSQDVVDAVVDLVSGTDGTIYDPLTVPVWKRHSRTMRAAGRGLWLSGFAAGFLFAIICGQAKAETVDGRRIVLIDGDTISVGTERIRLLDIDTPETFHPRCEAEMVVGLKAKERLGQLLRQGAVDIDRHGQDRYRRTLARLSVGGHDVGEILLGEGLAVRWQPGRQAWEERAAHWCGARR